ncbi:hypothetical protein [Methylobacterium iners]|uniref:Uncharacterized protein n=1 Tax=Methylobacterium iners TaxID=418707 RepID=A0ABQ4RWK0_9HYPH|nr:hypothetical protein [Methylobacterium iners]GJD93972.1 hypothetical protein OCOJLMKI_1170 [Methylobacterium iners]
MLRKLFATVSRRDADEVLMEQQPAHFPPETMKFKPMVPVHPPPAQNDDVMQGVYEEVEKALRASGYLR